MATVTVDSDLLVGLTVTSTVVDLHVPNQLTVSGGTGSSTLAGLTDVQVATPSAGQGLAWNGTKWANVSPVGAVTAAGEGVTPTFADTLLSGFLGTLVDFDGTSDLDITGGATLVEGAGSSRAAWTCPGSPTGTAQLAGVWVDLSFAEGLAGVVVVGAVNADGPVAGRFVQPGSLNPLEDGVTFGAIASSSAAVDSHMFLLFDDPAVAAAGDVQLVVAAAGAPDVSVGATWLFVDPNAPGTLNLLKQLAGAFVMPGQTGLFAPTTGLSFNTFFHQLEAFLDRRRLCDQIVTPEAVAASGAGDIDTLAAGPVADEDQPLDIFGNPLGKGKRVVFLSTGSSSLGGAWYGTTDESTGQLRVDNYPVRSYGDGAGTNALVGGCMAVAPNVIAIYDGTNGGLAAVLGADDTTQNGTWNIVTAGDGGGLDEAGVQALIDASDISIARIVSDGMGTTLPDILVASTVARDTEVAAGDAATLASAESYTDTAVAGKVSASTVDAKGDLLVGTADNTVARLPVGSDGRVPVASANETSGLIYARPSLALVASGRYSTSAFTWTSATVAANRLFYIPFLVPKRMTFDRIAVNHSATTGGSGSVARLGIYASSGDLPAGLILDAGTIDLTTTPALKAVTISQTLDPGMYWLAAVAQTVAPASSFSCISSGPVVPSDAAAGSGSSYGLAESSVTGSLPSSATPGATAFQPINVWLRAA